MTDTQATDTAGTAVLGVDNVLFAVGDLTEAVAFYRDALGLPLAFQLDGPGIALFRLGTEAPGLLLRAQPEPAGSGAGGGGRVWLEVRDAQATAATLAGVPGTGMPFQVATGWTVEVTDPWGNTVGFTDYTTMPERARP
jgi:catechol 2,3-dioxygenase-like lactoylglutathione lyase family enzyme